ncbi:uncharacterized protein LOC110011758 [Sesamum indicum]|uniref:Uncharacterized protein LOC110011758 n=1 Tax=Sesamum indicum TaxID=4182 RepID=A0A8M8UX60_SESIN|nr:uncharacterized protein LOC110011758 [Sesamum indicum]
MAVAAYATLRSLSHVLNNLQLPARLRRLHVDTNRIQSLQETVQFLLDFLEAHSQRISEEIGVVGRQIADAAAEAEEVVDRHVVDQLRFGSEEESHCMAALSSFSQDIDKVTGKLDSLTTELTKMVKEEWAVDAQEEQCIVSVPVKSPKVLSSSGKKTTVVGFDEHLEQIVDELTRDEPDLQILPIVGMGGIANCFEEHEWNQVEGNFPRLKFLKISDNDHLKRWGAENIDIHFPKLESLFLDYMRELEEIPANLGDIPTLHSIYLAGSDDSVIDLAKQGVEAQHSNGNVILQLYIDGERYQVGSS